MLIMPGHYGKPKKPKAPKAPKTPQRPAPTGQLKRKRQGMR